MMRVTATISTRAFHCFMEKNRLYKANFNTTWGSEKAVYMFHHKCSMMHLHDYLHLFFPGCVFVCQCVVFVESVYLCNRYPHQDKYTLIGFHFKLRGHHLCLTRSGKHESRRSEAKEDLIRLGFKGTSVSNNNLEDSNGSLSMFY